MPPPPPLAVRRRRRRRARAVTVFLAWYEDLRLPVPAVLRRKVRECTSDISHFS
jgi:hypothetical protein